MIYIRKSPTADTRTCDFSKVTREQLRRSSMEHIRDVRSGLRFMADEIHEAAERHDFDKISNLDQFWDDFIHGFAEGHQSWWREHKKLNRHHLADPEGVRPNVNLIDVLDYIVDCVMAGMARSGSVRPVTIDPYVLNLAFINTVELMKQQVRVEE